MSAMKYLDANIIILAFTDRQTRGKKSRELLVDHLNHGKPVCTSTLALDEVVWVIGKKLGRRKAIQVGKDFLNDPRVKIIDVTSEIMKAAFNLMEKSALDPRDAIHAAACLSVNAVMISEDKDFSQVQELKRQWIE